MREWQEQHPKCHPFFQMAGRGIDMVFPDLMHTKHLGTDQVLVASVITWLIKFFLRGTIQENIDMPHHVWESPTKGDTKKSSLRNKRVPH